MHTQRFKSIFGITHVSFNSGFSIFILNGSGFGSFDIRQFGVRHNFRFLIFKVDVEGGALNLRLVPGRFSPTSGPTGSMGYLELIFLRFQGLIWCINHFCILLGSGDIR